MAGIDSPMRLVAALVGFAPILTGQAGVSAASEAGFWKPPAFTRLDSLFITAATGEPRFEKRRDSCEKALLAMDTTALRYLLRERMIRQTPRQRHYVERVFTVLSDSGGNPGPGRMLAQALAPNPDSIRVQLLYIGSLLGDSAFRRAALPYLRSDSSEVRRMAVRCLGAYPHPDNTALLWAGLEKTRGLELQQRLWSLDAQGPIREWRRLVPVLRDSLFVNRRKARDLMLKAADSSWKILASSLSKSPAKAEALEWCLLALDAKEAGGFLDGMLPRLSDEEKRLFERWRKRPSRSNVVQ